CRLMLPVALMSGVLFTWLGAALRRSHGEDATAAGQLTLANTGGAMTGSLLAGFVLLPTLGLEGSLFLLAFAYGGVALLAGLRHARDGRAARLALGLMGGVFALSVDLVAF